MLIPLRSYIQIDQKLIKFLTNIQLFFYSFYGCLGNSILGLVFVSLFLFSTVGFGQANNCAITPSIVVGATCTTINYNVANTFTNSGVGKSCPENSIRDGWFSFTTDATTTLINIVGTSNRNLGLALYDNSCALPNEIVCTTPNTGNASLMNVGVNPNTTYFLRLMRTNTGNNDMTGTICVYRPPANDSRLFTSDYFLVIKLLN